MFLRSPPRLFFAFSRARLVTRCLHRVTLPPIGHRISRRRSFTTPAPQVAQRLALLFLLGSTFVMIVVKRHPSALDKTVFSSNLSMMHLPTLPWRSCLTGCRMSWIRTGIPHWRSSITCVFPRTAACALYLCFTDCPCSTEWGHDPRSRPAWYVCDQ